MQINLIELLGMVQKKFLMIFLIMTSIVLTAQQTGNITGTVVDEEFGDALIGANILLEGTAIGAATDIEGKYLIENVPEGKYNIIFSSIGFARQIVTDVVVTAGGLVKIDIAMKTESFETDDVVITAKAAVDSEAGLLINRQKASSISDAISAEAISRSASSDAAAAMTKVTGASVVGGKYVYIRGLGDRYSSTQLNGAELPSADPDKKSFQLDLFPSSLLDNITTIKTFTPDKPGTFTGGLVDVTMKNFPEKFTANVSVSSGYNTQASLKDIILPNQGGHDWLGMDDGTRNIPAILRDPDIEIPRYTAVKTKEEAVRLDKISRSFNTHMTPISAGTGLNSGLSMSIGNQFEIGDKVFGLLGSLTWSQNYSYYGNGEIGRWKLPGTVDDIEALDFERDFRDEKGVHEANWGAILSLSMKDNTFGQIKASYLRTQSGESSARYITGKWTDIPSSATYETRVLQYTERSLDTYQFEGLHVVNPLADLKIDWKISYSLNEQDEPDLRYFSNHWTVKKSTGDTIYQSPSSLYPPGIRYFRNLQEDNLTGNLNFELPIKVWNGHSAKLKFGGAYTAIDRTYDQRRFEYDADGEGINFSQFNGDIDEYFGTVGIIDSAQSYFVFGNVIGEAKSPKNRFRGNQTTAAGFLMIDLPVTDQLRLIGGVRAESTEMNAFSDDTTAAKGYLDNTDFLPSLNLVYQLQNNMNLRFAYSNTVARPTFRELAPYTNFEFYGDYLFTGNANLKRTFITNYDLRWEWFVNPGELIAVSAFYKDFKDPIEKFQNNSIPNGLLSVQNVDNASLYGIEFELRKNLGIIHSFLGNFNIGTNVSFVESETKIPATELFLIRISDPKAPDTRPFIGQSPHLINVNLSYDNYDEDIYAGLFYNIFGDRLAIVTEGASPDVFERGYGSLDMKVTKGLFDILSVSFTAKNLLDPDIEFTQEFKGEHFIYHKYSKGRTFSMSLNLKI
ncbi:MAG: TonB-dependent receptor [Melioribacteraceae bacterium]|nr:TonB-dependent receptor [Melioribacteraceae bacterium]